MCRGASGLRRRVGSSGEREVDPCPCPCSPVGIAAGRQGHDQGALMSVLPVPDVEASRQLGRGAVAAMLAVAADSPIGAVIESNFYRSVAAQSLGELPGAIVEVFCRCSREVALERYRDRAGRRHAGHFDGDRDVDELWNDEVAGARCRWLACARGRQRPSRGCRSRCGLRPQRISIETLQRAVPSGSGPRRRQCRRDSARV